MSESKGHRCLIGLTGHQFAGKSEAARILAEEYRAVVVSLESLVREALLAVDPSVGRDKRLSKVLDAVPGGWDGLLEDRVYGAEVRKLLERLEAQMRLSAGPSVWVRGAIKDVPSDALIVFDGVYTEDDAAWILRHGGVLWGIDRPGGQELSRFPISEHLVDDVIVNDDTRTQIRDQIESMMEAHGVSKAPRLGLHRAAERTVLSHTSEP